LAPSRNATSSTHPLASRLSFAKISEPLPVPDLLDLQVKSFDWLLGNDVWRARVEEAAAAGKWRGKMSDAVSLDWIGATLRAVQAEQRSIRDENRLIRSALNEAITVIIQRIGVFEALVDVRVDGVEKRIDAIAKGIDDIKVMLGARP